MDIEYILKALEIFTEAESQAKWSTQPRIILEMAAIKLVNAEDELSLLERVERLEKGIVAPRDLSRSNTVERKERPVERQVERRPVANESPSREPIKEEKAKEEVAKQDIIDDGSELTLDMIVSQWQNVLQEIKSSKISLYALIIEGEVVSFENNLLTIGYKESFGFHQQAVSKKDNKEFVEQIISKYFNKNILVNFIMGNKKIQTKEAEHDEGKEEAIKGVLDFFGDIVEIK